MKQEARREIISSNFKRQTCKAKGRHCLSEADRALLRSQHLSSQILSVFVAQASSLLEEVPFLLSYTAPPWNLEELCNYCARVSSRPPGPASRCLRSQSRCGHQAAGWPGPGLAQYTSGYTRATTSRSADTVPPPSRQLPSRTWASGCKMR